MKISENITKLLVKTKKNILRKYNLAFNEIQTFESDLEDIFLELIKKNK